MTPGRCHARGHALSHYLDVAAAAHTACSCVEHSVTTAGRRAKVNRTGPPKIGTRFFVIHIFIHRACSLNLPHTNFFSGIEPGYSPQFAQFLLAVQCLCWRSDYRAEICATYGNVYLLYTAHWTSGFFVFHRWWSVRAHNTLGGPSVDGSCFTTSDTSTGTSEHGYRRARDISRHLYRLSPERAYGRINRYDPLNKTHWQ